MALMDGHKGGKLGLPADHWMHKALAKEKDRIAKKKNGKGVVKPKAPAALPMQMHPAPMMPSHPAQPTPASKPLGPPVRVPGMGV